MSKSPYAQFKTDQNLEKDGIFLDYGDFRFKVARAGGANQRFQKILAAKFKPHRRLMQLDVMDDDLARKLLAESYAEAVILGWDHKVGEGESAKWEPGMIDEEGKVMEFNNENVIKVLLDLPELFRDIQGQCDSAANFQLESRKETAKNSKPASGGN